MAFWQVFLIFSLLCALFILWPFFVQQKRHKLGLRTGIRSDARDAIFEDRKSELLAAKEVGEINEEEMLALREDLTVTRQSQEQNRPDDPIRPVAYGYKSRVTVGVLATIVPLAALFMYTQVGAFADWKITDSLQKLSASDDVTREQMVSLQRDIIGRLDKTPDNSNLWFLLASVSTQVGDFEEAVKSYRFLESIHPESPVIIAELAQALFLRAGNVVTPEVRENTAKALELNAEIPTALGLAGIDAFQKQDYQIAIDFWQKAVKRLDPNSAASQALSEGIVRAQSALGISANSKAKTAGKEQAASVSVRVNLAENVAGLEGNETLFIYARAWQGPRMPLAIQRLSATKFPITVTLDTSMAMAAGMDITSVAQLELVARISASGNAVPQSGDWMGSFGPVILGENSGAVAVTISDQVP